MYHKRVARTAALAVRVSCLAIVIIVSYSSAVSRLRRPFLSNRYFFITVRLLKRRTKLSEPDFALLARGFNRARALHCFYLTAWVFSSQRRTGNFLGLERNQRKEVFITQLLGLDRLRLISATARRFAEEAGKNVLALGGESKSLTQSRKTTTHLIKRAAGGINWCNGDGSSTTHSFRIADNTPGMR